MAQQTFVIVGGGLAGAKAAQTLREEGFAGRIHLIGAEPERPYERPPLSKAYLTGAADADSSHVHEPGWYDEHEVDLRLGSPAVDLDRTRHQLTLATGRTPRLRQAAARHRSRSAGLGARADAACPARRWGSSAASRLLPGRAGRGNCSMVARDPLLRRLGRVEHAVAACDHERRRPHPESSARARRVRTRRPRQ
jgi:hypothetical protein